MKKEIPFWMRTRTGDELWREMMAHFPKWAEALTSAGYLGKADLYGQDERRQVIFDMQRVTEEGTLCCTVVLQMQEIEDFPEAFAYQDSSGGLVVQHIASEEQRKTVIGQLGLRQVAPRQRVTGYIMEAEYSRVFIPATSETGKGENIGGSCFCASASAPDPFLRALQLLGKTPDVPKVT